MATNDREIERKYLLRALPPESAAGKRVEVDQGYLPGDRILERIRRMRAPDSTRYYRTIKMGSGIERFELEEETTQLFFDTVWPLTRGKRVQKCRYYVPDASGTWEIDDFRDRALVLAELELERVDQVVELPKWLDAVLIREVTDEPSFSNFSLAK